VYRRTVLAYGVVNVLSGCASRGATPTTPTVNLGKILWNPIRERVPSGETGPFDITLLTPRPAATTSRAPAVNPMLLGIAIGQALRASSDAKTSATKLAIANALQPLEFAPRDTLSSALRAEFVKRLLPIEGLGEDQSNDGDGAARDSTKVAPDFDAVLDIEIAGAGYFPEVEAGGFSPTLYITSRLLPASGKGKAIEEFSYEADYRDSGGDVRFFTTPKSISLSALTEVRDHSQQIREALGALVATIAERMADDIERVVKKLPRVE
jgi:hypothetical protein